MLLLPAGPRAISDVKDIEILQNSGYLTPKGTLYKANFFIS